MCVCMYVCMCIHMRVCACVYLYVMSPSKYSPVLCRVDGGDIVVTRTASKMTHDPQVKRGDP